MPRIPSVTRTMKTTHVMVKAVDIDNEKMLDLEFKLPRTYKNEDAMMKMVNKLHSNPSVKIVKIMDARVETHKYEASEDDYLSIAHIVD